jgi:hypothetical protein
MRLPSRRYDELYTQARQQRCTVPELIRRKLHITRPPQADETDGDEE